MPRRESRPSVLADSPHRDSGVAAAARVVQLEDELRALRTKPGAQKRPRRTRGRLVGLALVLGGGAAYVWWSGKPALQTVTPSNAGLAYTVVFRTDVREVAFVDEAGAEVPQLAPHYLAQPDGTAAAVRSASVLLPDSRLAASGPTRLFVRYRAWGIPRSATLTFRAKEDSNLWMKDVLLGLPQWVAFRDYGGQTLVYFSTLLAYKPTLWEIRWGLGDGPLDRTVAYERSTKTGISTADEIYVSVPPDTPHVRVQLTFTDGSKSEVRTILRSDSNIP